MRLAIIILSVLFSSVIYGQADITPRVSDALKRGDAAGVAAYFMPQVDLTLLDAEKNYSKADAQKALAGFFGQYGVRGFTIKHQGTSKLDDQYRIGELNTTKGNLRVTFFMRKSGEVLLIKQLKIESDN